MRINKFNPNYIMIDFSDIARITLSQAKNYEKEFISEFINIEKIIYKDYKDKFNKYKMYYEKIFSEIENRVNEFCK